MKTIIEFVTSFSMLAFATAVFVAPIPAAAQSNPGGLAGFYEGELFVNGPDGQTEPISFRFDAGGGFYLISQLEAAERESVGVGVWKRSRGNEAEFGYIQYREGEGFICNGLDTSAPPGSCTLVGTGRVAVEHFHGELSGFLEIVVKERSDGGENLMFGPIALSAVKRTVADLQAMQ